MWLPSAATRSSCPYPSPLAELFRRPLRLALFGEAVSIHRHDTSASRNACSEPQRGSLFGLRKVTDALYFSLAILRQRFSEGALVGQNVYDFVVHFLH